MTIGARDDQTPPFDRRVGDLNMSALSVRVDALERRMELVEGEVRNNNREIAANTALTEQIHGQTAEMYELFNTARNGFKMIASVGNGAARVGRGAARAVEAGGRVAKPLFWIAALCAGVWTWVKTGQFTLPDWMSK